MTKTFSTGEEMHQHADNLPPHVAEMLANPPKDKAQALLSLCPLYQSARPLLASLATLFFIPQKLKDLIGGLITVLDLLCAPGVPPAAPAVEEAVPEKKHETHARSHHKK